MASNPSLRPRQWSLLRRFVSIEERLEAQTNPKPIAVGLFDQGAIIIEPNVADADIDESDFLAVLGAGVLNIVSRTSSLVRFRVSQRGFDLVPTAQPDRRAEADRSAATGAVATTQNAQVPSDPSRATRVFVVHGRTKGPRDAVARLIGDLGLVPVILEEEPDKGRTIIEKFEAHTDVAFAVVVLTPEDEGRMKGAGRRLNDRARQNVILELGFFIGLIGRSRVVAVPVGSVERPSDIDGVLYVPFDSPGAWRLRLIREFKAAGLPVDLSRV